MADQQTSQDTNISDDNSRGQAFQSIIDTPADQLLGPKNPESDNPILKDTDPSATDPSMLSHPPQGSHQQK